MRILYCISGLYKKGGTERILVTKANALAKLPDFSISIAINNQECHEYSYTLSDRVRIYDLKLKSLLPKFKIPCLSFLIQFFRSLRVYKKIVSEINPDIIIVMDRGFDDLVIPFFFDSRVCIREFHTSKFVIDSRCQNISGKFIHIVSFLYEKIYFWIFNKYSAVVVLTEKDRLYSNYTTKSYVIPNFLFHFPKQVACLDRQEVITVGRLDKNKNIQVQIRVWEKVVKKYPSWKLKIFGEGVEYQNLKNLIIELGLTQNVFLCGVKSDLDSEYLNSSFSLFTSLGEGFGLVLIESMSFGVPCISFDTPCGPSDIISNGIDGFLVPLGDEENLYNRIILLIEDSLLRKKMGIEAKSKAKNFTEENILYKWVDLFLKLKKNK